MSGREAVELARQSGAIRPLKPAASHGNRRAAEQPLSCTLAIYLSPAKSSNKRAGDLNETVLDNPDTQAHMTILVHLMSDDRAFDSRKLAVDWSVWETHDETD